MRHRPAPATQFSTMCAHVPRSYVNAPSSCKPRARAVSIRTLTNWRVSPAGVVSGFKEIRFVAGRAFPLETGYPLFESFVEWLLSLCNDVKVRGARSLVYGVDKDRVDRAYRRQLT